MLPLAIIEDLDVLEASGLHFCMGLVAYAIYSLILEAVEPTLRRGVVSSSAKESHLHDRVTGGSRPPPVPTERSVRISRTTLFSSRFTAPQ